MLTLTLFSYFVLVPATVTLLYRTNLFGMQDLSRYYSIGHSFHNSLPLFFFGLATAQVSLCCYALFSHYCPSFFIFKPWSYHWADLSSLLLADSIFGDLFIDVEGRYTSGDLILYDKTKILRHERILHTFDTSKNVYVLRPRQFTGSFILDLLKPKSLTIYQLVSNPCLSIEPFKFTNDFFPSPKLNPASTNGVLYIPKPAFK